MTETAVPATAPAAAADALHSANAGFVVHRTGQLEYGFAREGRDFAAELVGYLNRAQAGTISTFLFEEAFGARDRLHWLVHMRSPHDYQRLLDMVDHDRAYQDISELDRLPHKGGGNWERMFLPGTFSERVLCPQHGFAHPPEGAVDPARLFAEPACWQTSQPPELQLTTATAGAVVLRTGDARYDVRAQARTFAVDWLEEVNAALAGDVTVLLFEEIFGRQDRLHWLIHLRSLECWARLADVPPSDAGGRLFVPGSVRDTLLVPAGDDHRSEDHHDRNGNASR